MERNKNDNGTIFNLICKFTEGYLYKNTSTNYENIDTYINDIFQEKTLLKNY